MNITGVVGLDLSITGSGVVRYGAVSEKFEYIGTLGTKPTYGNIMKRIGFTASSIMSTMFDNDVVFIEDYAYGVRPGASSLATLAELGGVIKFLVYRKTGREAITVASTTIKKWLSGNGKLPQDDFKIAAYKKYKREFNTKDSVVAYSLADFGVNLVYGPIRELYKYELESINNFKKKHKDILHTFANGEKENED